MENIVNQRLRSYFKSNGVKLKFVAGYLSIPESTLNSKLSGPKAIDTDCLCAIIEHNPELSAEWLLRGTEPMTISDAASSGQTDEQLLRILAKQLKKIDDLECENAELKGGASAKPA